MTTQQAQPIEKKGKAVRLAREAAKASNAKPKIDPETLQTYNVYRSFPLRGHQYLEGETVEMKPKNAATLVSMGFIGKSPKPKKPSAEPKAKASK